MTCFVCEGSANRHDLLCMRWLCKSAWPVCYVKCIAGKTVYLRDSKIWRIAYRVSRIGTSLSTSTYGTHCRDSYWSWLSCIRLLLPFITTWTLLPLGHGSHHCYNITSLTLSLICSFSFRDWRLYLQKLCWSLLTLNLARFFQCDMTKLFTFIVRNGIASFNWFLLKWKFPLCRWSVRCGLVNHFC